MAVVISELGGGARPHQPDRKPAILAALGHVVPFLRRGRVEPISSQPTIMRYEAELQSALQELHLPKKMIFLDVNGTLIPEDSQDGSIPPADLRDFQTEVSRLTQSGIAIGLCSDSPLPQLQQFAARLGLSGPIIAENGAVVSFGTTRVVLGEVPDSERLIARVIDIAQQHRLQRLPDAIAPEFGGEQIDLTNGHYAFGANREATVSVFGSTTFITQLGEELHPEGCSMDISPEYGYLGIHPGGNFRDSKRQTLSAMANTGETKILMIGNSMSDNVQADNIRTAFVGGSMLTDAAAADERTYISPHTTMRGVIDILRQIQV